MKKLSLLKPYVQMTVLDNKIAEKVKYLKISSMVDAKTLRADVSRGAKQFAELQALVDKENEPQYILITTDNLEQGYMAVSYLAAAFNRKHGMYGDEEWECSLEKAEGQMEEWVEDPCLVPVIQEYELRQGMGSNGDPFSMGNMFLQGNQNCFSSRPYWMSCTENAVCVVSEGNGYRGMGMNGEENPLFTDLELFKNNDKVYVIALDTPCPWDTEENYGEGSGREKWNALILSLAMDEVVVKIDEKTEKAYYKELFRSGLQQKGISCVKNFSYSRIVNMVISMKEKNKCQLVENIIKYAAKDKGKEQKMILSDKDFDFMDRFCRTDTKKKEVKRSTTERMMEELVGMEEVKKQVLSVVRVMKYNKIREQMNMGNGGYHNVHLMLGAPGTAKTTVAQMMGQIMMEEKLLPDNRFICVNGAELKGMYVGHSAPRTKALFEENDIIVIDEAYSLVGDYGENDSYSKEVLAQLMVELERHSMDKLVIFAGYGGKRVSEKNNKMKDFLDANPGIKSRITSTIFFDSYSPEEMSRIFLRIAQNQKYHVEEGVEQLVISHFQKRVQDENFGNGREARSLLETAVLFAAERIFAADKDKDFDKRKYSKAEMQTITYEDVEKAVSRIEEGNQVQASWKSEVRIGF